MSEPLGSVLKPRDALLHSPPTNEPTWLETNGINFFVPDRKIRGHMPVKFRTNVGVVYSTIMVWSQDCRDYLDFDYYDAQVHLPMPLNNFDNYRLGNGLHVQVLEPHKRMHIKYDGFHGTHIEFELETLGVAIESKETKLPGPQGRDFSHFYPTKAMLADSVGHIDACMKAEGVLVLEGEEIRIWGPMMFDHSWGPRPEYGHACGNYDEGYFGQDGTDLAFHVMTLNPQPNKPEIINGFLIDHGEMTRIKGGEGRQHFEGWVPKGVEYDIEDERGKTYRLRAEHQNTARLPSLPNQWIWGSFTKWTLEGEEGWGECKWHWEVSDMRGTRDHTERPTTERRAAPIRK